MRTLLRLQRAGIAGSMRDPDGAEQPGIARTFQQHTAIHNKMQQENQCGAAAADEGVENMPIARMISSVCVNARPNLTSLSRLAPNMTGMARKNVNSAATVRDTPSSSAPTMVEPERDAAIKF